MNGISIGIDPIAFRVWHLSVGWYGIAIAAAILAAIWMALRQAKRVGISPDEVYSLVFWAIPAGFIGARLFHVIDRWSDYSGNIWNIFAVQQGGLAIWGGVIGGIGALLVVGKLRKLPLLVMLDAGVPAILIAQIIGRFGCIVNGDAWGGTTSMPWGFIYTNPNSMIPINLLDTPTHPYPVYDMLWNIASLLLIFRLRSNIKTNGVVFLSYIALYSTGRFFLSFVRQEEVWFWGLQEAQIVSLVALVFAAVGMTFLRRRKAQAPELTQGQQ